MKAHVEEFVARRWSVPRDVLTVQVEPIHGGLESAVALATVKGDARYPAVPGRFVVKELRPGFLRESDIYELLWKHLDEPPTPRVFGVQTVGDARYLYLEDLQPVSSWPWRDTLLTASVCRELARLHDSPALPPAMFAWDYEAELAASAESTLAVAVLARDAGGIRYWRRLGDLKRVVRGLASMRSRLLASAATVIHGDVHPGNVILRTGHPEMQVALIDWSRARIGSPLEDVASWLHSVGCWEPQARRRHDTLLRAYLDARVVPMPLSPELRMDYWLASASNGLAGAIRYHLAVVGDQSATEAMQYESRHALAEWERVIRRAAALLTASHDRCSGGR